MGAGTPVAAARLHRDLSLGGPVEHDADLVDRHRLVEETRGTERDRPDDCLGIRRRREDDDFGGRVPSGHGLKSIEARAFGKCRSSRHTSGAWSATAETASSGVSGQRHDVVAARLEGGTEGFEQQTVVVADHDPHACPSLRQER